MKEKIKTILIKKTKPKKIKDKEELIKENKILIKEVERIERFRCRYRKYIYSMSFLLVIYFLLIIFAKPIQSFILFPENYIKTNSLKKIRWGLINIKTREEKDITGAFIKWTNDKVIFYFYDGKDNYPEMIKLNTLWYSIMFYDYKSEIKSDNDFSLDKLSDVSNIFYSYILNKRAIKKEDVIILWQWRGSILASDFAVKIGIDKLVLVNPVSSLYNLAKNKTWFRFQKMLFLPDISSRKILWDFYKSTLVISWNINEDNLFIDSKNVFRNIPSNKKYFVELDNPLNKNILTNYDSVLDLIFSNFTKKWILESKYTFLDKNEVKRITNWINNKYIFDNIDLETDSSLTRFVNNKVSFTDIWYVPGELVPVWWEHIIDSKWNIRVKKILKDSLQDMANAFYEDTKNNIVVVSWYRSYLYQKWIKDRWCPDNLCAKAGYSEHQSGLAIDLYSASSNRNWANDNNLMKYYKWLSENAHKYGITNTYQKWLKIDGYEIEPWHWRYVWVELATLLKDKEITFAEFYNEKSNK